MKVNDGVDQKELDYAIERIFYAKQNVEAVLGIISDFVNFDQEIQVINE